MPADDHTLLVGQYARDVWMEALAAYVERWDEEFARQMAAGRDMLMAATLAHGAAQAPEPED